MLNFFMYPMAPTCLILLCILLSAPISNSFILNDRSHFNDTQSEPLSIFLNEEEGISLVHFDSPSSPFRANWTSNEEKWNHYALHGYIRSLTSSSSHHRNHLHSENRTIDIKELLKVVTKRYDLISPISNGLKSYGYYYLRIQMGTPPVDQIMIFDTSSDLTWVQCHSCRQCSKPSLKSYNPSRSKSDKIYSSCKDKPCNNQKIGAWCSSDTCNYNAFFADMARSTGQLGIERFLFGIANSQKMVGVKSVLFGCGMEQTNFPTGPNGVLAFGRGDSAIPNQFSQLLKRKAFTSCLVRHDFAEETSLLFMGKTAVPSRGIKYTPMLKSSKYYYVQVIKVQVGKSTVKIPASAWKMNTKTGSGGVILDTAPTFNYLLKSAIGPLAADIKKQVKLKAASRQGILPICFKYKFTTLSKLNRVFPKITFTFKGGVAVKLSAYHYVVKYSKNVVCTTFIRSATSNNIFGNYFQQNLLVVHDIAKSRIGMRAVDCVTRKPLN